MTQAPAEERRLQHQFRTFAVASALPILVLLALLIVREYRLQIARELELHTRLAEARIVSVQEIARSAAVHVAALRTAMHSALVTAQPPQFRPPDGATGDQPMDFYGRPALNDTHRLGIALGIPDRLRARPAGDREFAAAFDLFSQQGATLAALPYLRWSYYFSSSGDFVTIYPWAPLAELLGEANQVAALASFYDYDVYRLTTRERNPRREAIWTPAYFDAGGAGLMVSRNAPVDEGVRQLGMVGTDVLANALSERLATAPDAPAQMALLDQAGTVFALSGGLGKDDRLTPATRLFPGLAEERDAFVRIGGRYLRQSTVPGTPWTFVYAVKAPVVEASATAQVLPYVVYLIALAAALAVTAYLMRRRFIQPAFRLVDTIDALARGKAPPEPRVPAPWRTRFRQIIATFEASRRAEQARREAEAKSAAIIQVALDAVITADGEGRVVDFNPAAEAMFGHPAGAVKGMRIGDLLVPPALRARHEEGMARRRAGGPGHVLGQRVELEALHASGRVFPIEIQIHELTDAPGVRYAAYVRDLTEPKRAADEIAEQRERLHQAEKLTAMGSLLAGLAHELNNPLAVALAQTAMLEETADQPAVTGRAAKIRAAVERCSRIVRTFLSMARRQPPRRISVDLPALVAAAVEVIAYGLRSSGVELVQRHTPNLPKVEADPDQITQVVVNLVINAQQAFGDRPGRRVIWVETTTAEDGAVVLAVSDNGPGVPDELKPRIFEAFFTTKPVGAGTGVGLAVCRNIVEAHGGRIEIADRPGGGALFRIILPRGGEAAPKPPAATEPPAAPAPAGAAAILVVDDEAEVGAALADFLAIDGHAATVANSVADALGLLGGHRFQMAFCDLHMPGGGGIAFWNAVAARDPALAERVVFVTGDTVAGPDLLRRAAAGRTVRILEKPFVIGAVRAAVGDVLDGQR